MVSFLRNADLPLSMRLGLALASAGQSFLFMSWTILGADFCLLPWSSHFFRQIFKTDFVHTCIFSFSDFATSFFFFPFYFWWWFVCLCVWKLRWSIQRLCCYICAIGLISFFLLLPLAANDGMPLCVGHFLL